LIKTRTNGLILRPDFENKLKVNCYVLDADFAGLWNVEDDQDPHASTTSSGRHMMAWWLFIVDNKPQRLYW